MLDLVQIDTEEATSSPTAPDFTTVEANCDASSRELKATKYYPLPKPADDVTGGLFFHATQGYKETGVLTREIISSHFAEIKREPRKYEWAFEVLLFNAVCSSLFYIQYGAYVPFALSTRNGSPWSKKFGEARLKKAVEILEMKELVEIKKGFWKKKKSTQHGLATKFYPTTELIELVYENIHTLNPSSIVKDTYKMNEPCSSYNADSSTHKSIIENTKKVVSGLNNLILGATFQISREFSLNDDMSSVIASKLEATKRFGENFEIVPFSSGEFFGDDASDVDIDAELIQYQRVFKGHLAFGGRLYGGIQNLPREERFTLKINGNETCELDYKALHPAIIYCWAGCPELMPVDPYETGLVDRDIAKKVLLPIINASSRAEAIRGACSAIRKENKSRAKKKEKRLKLNGVKVGDLVDALKELHAPISEEYFYKGHGLMLQNEDSQIAMKVVEHFSSQGIVCMPIHDSFIVEEQYEDELRDVMKGAFEEIVGSPAPIIDRKA